jgi:hypothetical protein
VAIQLLQRDQHHTAWFSLGVSIDGQYWDSTLNHMY